MKRKTKIRKQSKQPISKLQRKIWLLCKLLTRKIHGNSCYTCTATDLVGSNWHTGHMISKAALGANLKYDLRVLRPQCGKCNLWNGGMGAEFLRKMIIREGQPYVDQIFRDRNLITPNTYSYYESLLAKYELMVEEL